MTLPAPLLTKIDPAALRETAMVLSWASPTTVNTPFAAENVALTVGNTRFRPGSNGDGRCPGHLGAGLRSGRSVHRLANVL
jgi:hypothetical protein